VQRLADLSHGAITWSSVPGGDQTLD